MLAGLKVAAVLTFAMEKVRINEIILDIVNGVKVSLKEGVSIETKIGGNGGGYRMIIILIIIVPWKSMRIKVVSLRQYQIS